MPDTGPHEDRMQLLRAARSGNEEARRALLGLCYTELRRLAHRLLRGDATAQRLQPAELVHDAARRVLDFDRMEWRERAHFLATVVPIMRQALLDEVRRSRAARHAAPPVTATLTDPGLAAADFDLEQLDAALRELQSIDPERARLVELRLLAGLVVEETAEVLELSPATVRRRWDMSRAWLLRRLASAGSAGETAGAAEVLQREREFERLLLDAADQALDWPPEERDTRLAEYYGADDATLARIRELLAIAEAGRRSALPGAGPGLTDETGGDLPPPPRIGPYRIGELLGRDRLGRVFRAERADGAFAQPVAIKLMRCGFPSEALEAQFVRELRGLSELRHPHIARLLDGGVTAEGQAYLVMEQVHGPSLVQYTAANRLSLRDTVALFLPVCDAVAHAHGRLRAHADIEPGNVIVTDDAQPKLLDYGMAGLLESATPAPGTAVAASAGTATPAPAGPIREYASPARRRGESATTGDDLYSLGVLLEELLARCPETPPDLRAVAARARAEDPAARPPSVAALREDLRRWLDGETVGAYEGGWRYVAGRWVARHRVASGVAALALLLLAGAALALPLLYGRAAGDRERAEQRFAEVRALSDHLLFDVYDRLERVPRTLPLRRDLAEQAQRYLDRLAADPDAPPELRLEVAEGLRRLAHAQGAPGGASLGESARARANLARATALTDAVADTRALRDARALTAVRLALLEAAIAHSVALDFGAAEAALTRARDRLDTLRARGASTPEAAALERDWAAERATLLQWQGRHREARDVAAAALAGLADAAAPDPRHALAIQRARLLDLLAESRFHGGQAEESVAAYREQLEVLESAARASPEDVALGRRVARAGWALGNTLLGLSRADEAEPLLAQSRARFEQLLLLEPDDRELARNHDLAAHAHAEALARLRRFAEAEPILRLSIAYRSARLDAEPADARLRRDLAIARATLGDLQVEQGQRRDACALYGEAAADLERVRASGKLPTLDQDFSVRRLRAQQARHCPR